ncbi:MAG TPA: hypothetical protein VKP12_11395, partial [Kiloniellaceae bacterium]|nr:hypothetical protein [Kiloniellaceae bacterium]
RVLRVPVAYFFQGLSPDGGLAAASESSSPAPSFSEENVSDLLNRNDSLKLIQAYNRISDPGVRRQIYALVRSVGEQDGLAGRFL